MYYKNQYKACKSAVVCTRVLLFLVVLCKVKSLDVLHCTMKDEMRNGFE